MILYATLLYPIRCGDHFGPPVFVRERLGPRKHRGVVRACPIRPLETTVYLKRRKKYRC